MSTTEEVNVSTVDKAFPWRVIGENGYVVFSSAFRADAMRYAKGHPGWKVEHVASEPAVETADESRWMIAYAIPGYLPNVDEGSEPIALSDLDSALADELKRAADHAEESAHALAESHEYADAWREHERAERLATLALNVSPTRREAPLYVGNLPAWLATLDTIVRETFPVYVSEHEALYVWQVEEGEESV